jgi:hypothetical protein
MPLSLEEKEAIFPKLDVLVDGRAPEGKSRYFQALCALLKDLSTELQRDPVKVPVDWAKK